MKTKHSLWRSLLYGSFIFFAMSGCRSKESGATSEKAGEAASTVTDEAAPVSLSGSASSSNAADANIAASSGDASKPQKTQAIPSEADAPVSRMLTKEGTLRWETRDLHKTHDAMLKLVQQYHAYVSADNQVRDEYQVSNSMEMRIPSDQFDAFLAGIAGTVSKFDEKSIKVSDVTEEYIDVSARIKTKQKLEEEYYDLLKRAGKISDVLEVEQQLNAVREEIESAQGRVKYLKDRVGMSTLNISFYETTSAPVGFFGESAKSFLEGWKGLLYFILGVLRIWPIVLIGAILLFWLIRVRNRHAKLK